MDLRKEVKGLNSIRVEINKTEELLTDVVEKLEERKKILTQDAEFISLNAEYMELQKKHSELINNFASKTDAFISTNGV